MGGQSLLTIMQFVLQLPSFGEYLKMVKFSTPYPSRLYYPGQLFCYRWLSHASEKHLTQKASSFCFLLRPVPLSRPIALPQPLVLLPLVFTLLAFRIPCMGEYYLLWFTHLIPRFSYLNLELQTSRYNRVPLIRQHSFPIRF